MISLSLSSSLMGDLQNRFGQTSEAGVLVSKALEAAIENDVAASVVKADYRDASNYRPYYVSRRLQMRLHKRLESHKKKDPSATLSSLSLGLIAAVADPQALAGPDPKTHAEHPPYLDWLKNAGLSSRPEQERMIHSLLCGLQARPDGIIFSEASVGVGKTHAKAAVAILRAQQLIADSAEGSVVITAPTYQTAKQILLAINQLVDASSLGVEAALVRSRAEYISVKLLQETLEEDASIPKKVKAQAVELLNGNIYLRERFEAIGLECRHLTLSRYSDPDDPAELAYQYERKTYCRERIIVCTHAFLACHVSCLRRLIARDLDDLDGLRFFEFNRICMGYLRDHPEALTDNRLLPEIDLLIVDEAHTLSESYQSLRDKRISLHVLKRVIQKVFASKATKGMTQFIDDFVDEAVLNLNNSGHYPAQLTTALMDGLKPLQAKLKSKRNTPEKLLLLEMMGEIRDIAASQRHRHELYLSPVRRHSSIRLQASEPTDWLDFTWLLAKQSICVSGTLAVGVGHGAYLPIAGKLSIDFDRLYEVTPIETDWLRKGVTLHAPEPSLSSKAMKIRYSDSAFLPPTSNKAADITRWVSQQSRYIASHLNRVAGGAIVACTSYEQIELLHGELVDQLKDLKGIHLMHSEPSRSLVSQVAEYKQKYREGLRPVWVAIISVGTGVDITDSDVPADQDHMLAQLFVTRIPLSPKERISHLQRINNALVLFKQLTGRLVRRPGRQGMHLHVMDARCKLKTGVYRRFQLLVNKYPAQQQILP